MKALYNDGHQHGSDSAPVPAGSTLNRSRLDPRAVWLVYLSCTVWASTCGSHLSALFWAVGAALALIFAARGLRGEAGVSGRWFLWTIAMAGLTWLMYSFLTPGAAHAIWEFGPLRLTTEGSSVGAQAALRLVALVCLTGALIRASSPLGLAAGVARFLGPLRHVGVRVESPFYFVFFLLRMIPLLVTEARLIGLAQRARGIGRESGLRGRVRGSAALVIPVLAAGLYRSDQLAMSLAARGFDLSRRPRAVTGLRFTLKDWILTAGMAAGWVIWAERFSG